MPGIWTWLRNLALRLPGAREANVSVEFAAATPVLLLLALGGYDYGRAYTEEIRMRGAARAGAQHALYEPANWAESTTIERIALEDYAGRALTADEIAGLSVGATTNSYCACTGGAEVLCSATCPDGSSPGRFLQVRLTGSVPLTFPYPWTAGDQAAVAGEAVVRVR